MFKETIFSLYSPQRKDSLEEFLRKNNIIDETEKVEDLITRVVEHSVSIEDEFGTNLTIREKFKIQITELIGFGYFMPQTTNLQNAGRFQDYALSACTVPDIDWKQDFETIKSLIQNQHIAGMGTGFNIDECEVPVKTMEMINSIALDGFNRIGYLRPVGNMIVITVDHPKIVEAIQFKKDPERNKWKFNFSVNLTTEFMGAIAAKKDYLLKNGKKQDPFRILTLIAEMIIVSGDPGIVWLDRFNERNPLPNLGEYQTVSPCGEVGLIKGESCQFGYLNLAAFVEGGEVDYDLLKEAVTVAIRFLDNSLENSAKVFNSHIMTEIANKKRKIGLGICGWADLLLLLGIEYGSHESLKLAENIMSFVNFHSKVASVELAKERGSFSVFDDPGNRYKEDYIDFLYSDKSTDTISNTDWKELKNTIIKNGIRNSITNSLPPTGRSALILGTSAQIEPHFSIKPGIEVYENRVQKEFLDGQSAGQKNGASSSLLLTALNLSGGKHISTASAFQKFTDEAISKTINLPSDTGVETIVDLILRSYEEGLAMISMYVDGSRLDQPEVLN